MKDLTTGPVTGHILKLSAFIALSTLFQIGDLKIPTLIQIGTVLINMVLAPC